MEPISRPFTPAASNSDLPSSQTTPLATGDFLYQQLGENSIRLLLLHPGIESAPIQCQLSEVPRKDNPVYEALSYMWGSPNTPKSINVNGKNVFVGENLWNALRNLRLKSKARTIWVDAVCINQHDIPERNEQVLVMSHIYQEAKKVLIYIGEHSDDVQAAFDVYATIRRHLSISWVMSTQLGSKEAKALVALCHRPYWRRVWIIQEILSASKLEIVCGTHRLKWRHFSTTLRHIVVKTPTSTYPTRVEVFRRALSSADYEELKRACRSSPAFEIVRFHYGLQGIYSLRQLLEL
jgi:hypothetical protein